MTKTEIAKKAITTIVGIGTARIVASIIQNNTPTDSVADKVTVTSASVVLGMMAADASQQYTDDFIDKLLASVNSPSVKIVA